jgi:hypothetical protein
MQLKTKEPAHGAFAYFAKLFKHFISFNSFGMADPQNGGINKGDTGALTPAAVMEEQHKGHCTAVA